MAATSCTPGDLLRSASAEDVPRAGAIAANDQARRFRALVETHYDFVWRSLRGLGVAHGWVEDAAQHVFFVASQKIAEIAIGKERSFLFGTVVGVAANARRAQAALREVSDEDVILDVADEHRDPEEEVARREQCRILEAVLDAMPDDLRVVFVLFELEGLSSIEIGSLLQIPTGTAASRLRRAREDFQARIARAHANRGGLP
jgi:RNA polymerase sigma-70 factor (ECF subfamily)